MRVANLVAHLVFETGAIGERDDLLDLLDRGRHRDLAEDMLACFQCLDNVLPVEVIRGGDHDELDGRIGQELLEIRIPLAGGDVVAIANSLPELGLAIGNGHHLAAFECLERVQV